MHTKIGEVVCGLPATMGTGFSATRFRRTGFTTNVSPFVLVDHYRMRARTFGPHPHAGFSSVTLAFDDCVGEVVSRDSIGHKTPIRAGDLHWTLAGRGVVHSQEPEAEGVSFHGLQIFVNLPECLKLAKPASWLRVSVAGNSALSPEIRAAVLIRPDGYVAWVGDRRRMFSRCDEHLVRTTWLGPVDEYARP